MHLLEHRGFQIGRITPQLCWFTLAESNDDIENFIGALVAGLIVSHSQVLEAQSYSLEGIRSCLNHANVRWAGLVGTKNRMNYLYTILYE